MSCNSIYFRPCIEEPEPMIVGSSEPELLQPKMLTDLALEDAIRLPDSPSHMFLGRNASKPVSSNESISFRQSENGSSAFTVFSQNSNNSSCSQIPSLSNVAATVNAKLTIYRDEDFDRMAANQSSAEHEKNTIMAVPSFHSNHVSYAFCF